MKLNYPAIVLAAVVDWVLGAVWFTAFAKPWIADLRLSAEEIAFYRSHMTPWPYVIAFGCSLVLAYGIACAVTRSGSPEGQTALRGLRLGLAVGAVIFAAMLTELVFERHTAVFIAIAAGYPLIGMTIMGTIVGAWRGRQKLEAGRSAGA